MEWTCTKRLSLRISYIFLFLSHFASQVCASEFIIQSQSGHNIRSIIEIAAAFSVPSSFVLEPRIKSISYFPSICGNTDNMTRIAVQQGYFSANNAFPNVQEWFKQCSYGKTTYLPEDNLIIADQPSLPCSGNWPIMPWTWPSCNDALIWQIYHTAINHTTSVLRLSTNVYKRQMIFMPPKVCGFAGLAMVGCSPGPCGIWYNGYCVTLIAHEVGHTMGLNHATTEGKEYGDSSDVMGFGNSQRCLNAPYSAQMGWSQPLMVLSYSQSNHRARWTQYRIPPMQSNDTNHVRIDGVNWDTSIPSTLIYISFRCRIGYDRGLLNLYNNKVSIHRITGEGKSELIAILGQGDELILPFRPPHTPKIIARRIVWNVEAIVDVCLPNIDGSGCVVQGVSPRHPPPRHPSPSPIRRPPPPSPIRRPPPSPIRRPPPPPPIRRPPPPPPPSPIRRPPPPSPIRRPPPPPDNSCNCIPRMPTSFVRFSN
jgi:hypothetical protein